MASKKKRIELYVDSVKGVSQGGNPYSAGKNPHRVRRRFGSLEGHVKVTDIAHAGWSEKEKKVKRTLDKLAEQYDFELVVYDVARTRHMLRAYFKGVRRIPQVIVGKHKMTGKLSEEKIIRALNCSCPKCI